MDDSARLREQLSALGRATRQFGRARSTAEVYRHALEAIAVVSGAPRASILLFDPDGVLRFKAWSGLSDGYRAAVEGHTPWSPGQPDPEPILTTDVALDHSLGKYQPIILAEGIRALAFFPLVTGGGTVGKFMVYRNEPHHHGNLEVELMQALAALTAFALDRQRAVDALEMERRLFVGGPTVVFKWRNAPGWPVEYVSPNVEQVFGVTPLDLTTGRVPYASLIHPEDLTRVADEVAQHTRDQRTWFEQEYRLKRSGDGTWRWIYDFTVPVRAGDVVTHYQGYVLDQTERRAATDALNQRQRLESLGVLAGGVAHDFNNLLQGVMGNVALAQEVLPQDTEAAGYLQDAATAATRASDLTRQLLAYSGRGMVVPETLDLAALVAECVRMLGSSLTARAVLQVDLPARLPPVRGDATQLRQVALNLLTNAADALQGAPGTITVAVALEDLQVPLVQAALDATPLPAGRYLVLRVRDTGAGMDAATRSRIFEPFFSTKGAGRGLGLSAVLGIARAHRGGVRVVSGQGKGTEFAFYLPVNTSTPPVARAEPASTVGAHAHKKLGLAVLVVDDDEGVRQFARRSLELAGCTVAMAQDAEEGLRLMEAALPDVLVLDLTMPGMGGQEALRRVQERWPSLPVVVCSGYTAEALPSVVSAGTRFLHKPYPPAVLVDTVQAAAGKD